MLHFLFNMLHYLMFEVLEPDGARGAAAAGAHLHLSPYGDEPRTGQGRMGMSMGGASRPWVFPFRARVPQVAGCLPGCPRAYAACRCRRGNCDVPAAVSFGVVEQRKPEPARLHNQIVIS